jgi:Domain of unknown function (DUF1844)
MEDQDDKRGFKVQDRRRFSAEGETKEGSDAPSESNEPLDIKSKPGASGAEPASKPAASGGHPAASGDRTESIRQSESSRQSSEPPPELTFAVFLWSLSEQALAALGEVPDPTSGQVSRDLTMAQQMIDIIAMLRDKTRGNLDPHEQALLKEILSSLQMKYVELARQPNR